MLTKSEIGSRELAGALTGQASPILWLPERGGRKAVGAPRRALTVTPEVEASLNRDAVVAVGVSGGKDSQALALAVARHLEAIGHKGPRLLVHADLGQVEWADSIRSCERIAEHLGWELMVVRRERGGLLERWEERWVANVGRYERLDVMRLILPWSTAALRFCTGETKTVPIARALRRRFGDREVLNVVGIRREESAVRERRPVCETNEAIVRKGGHGLTWNAVIDWDVGDVWDEIDASGLIAHEAYTRYGSSRVSCSFCILGSIGDLRAASACVGNHDTYRAMVGLEARSTFGLQGSRWLADVAPHLLSAELRAQVVWAKHAAKLRREAEAELPKDLKFERGVPNRMPTLSESALIASVRQRVSAAVGLDAQLLDGEAVLRHCKERMDHQAAGPRGRERSVAPERKRGGR